jgi:hypothetical protein
MNTILYKTTNVINGKYYIGIHTTDDIDDNYLGSGSLFIKALKKYGKHNFKKEILEIFENIEDALIAEKKYVITNQEDNNSYNLRTGGIGGAIHADSTKELLSEITKNQFASEDSRISHSNIMKEYYAKNPQSQETIEKRKVSCTGLTRSDETKEKMSTAQRKYFENNAVSQETKNKQSESASKRKTHAWTGKKRPVKICPHCGKEGADFAMNRWHFNNCKNLML